VPRQPDRIAVQGDNGTFDKFEELVITNDILGPSEATLTIGDDGAFAELEQIISPEFGAEFLVTLNERPRMKGRAEVLVVPGSASQGVKMALTIRTKMSDARVGSADPKVRVEKASIKDFILAVYKPLGLVEADFIFGDFTARNLITGKAKGAKAPIDFQKIRVQKAKVAPPETMFNAVERHLKRYSATQWDGPDGRFVIGAPDDSQEPLYRFLSRRGRDSAGNNVLSWRRVIDFTESPLTVEVYGQTFGKDVTKAQLRSIQTNPTIESAAFAGGNNQFQRRVIIASQQGKTQEQVDRTAVRELSMRRRREDAWEIEVDGWTYWNGSEQIPYANNTTADVDIEAAGGPKGRYLIVRTELRLGVGGSATTSMQLVAPGIWII
jgi:hypothetical protein